MQILIASATPHTHTHTHTHLNEVSILHVTDGHKDRKELLEVRVKIRLKVSGQLHQQAEEAQQGINDNYKPAANGDEISSHWQASKLIVPQDFP